MGRALSRDLRDRVVAAIETGAVGCRHPTAVSVRPNPCRSPGGPSSFRVELSGLPTTGHDLLALVV